MNKIKFMSLIGMVVALSMFVTACGSAATQVPAQPESNAPAAAPTNTEAASPTITVPEAAGPATQVSEEITLTWANWQWTETAKANQLRDLIKQFQANIQMTNLKNVIPWNDYEAAMITRWSGERARLVMCQMLHFLKL